MKYSVKRLVTSIGLCALVMGGHLASAQLRMPFESKGADIEVLRGHSAFDAIEAGRQTEGLEWLKEFGTLVTNKARLHAAIALAEVGKPLVALRLCHENLRSSGGLHEASRDLAVRIHGSLGEFSWAYQLDNADGPDSRYWLGGYLQFNERLQRGLIASRVQAIAGQVKENTAATSLIKALREHVSIQSLRSDVEPLEINAESLVSILESDLLLLKGDMAQSDWRDRFELFQNSGFDVDAGIAAARCLWEGSKAVSDQKALLLKEFKEADDLFAQAKAKMGEKVYYDALTLGLEALQRNPCSIELMELVYDAARENLDSDLALSLLALRWQTGDRNFDISEAMNLAIRKGDFALALSIGAESVKRHDVKWDVAYNLALAARAWDLRFMEARALRVLCDTGYQGGLYHLQDLSGVHGVDLGLSSLVENTYHGFDQNDQDDPLIESVVWRLQRDSKEAKPEFLSPEQQLDRLSKVTPSDQLHLAYFLALIDEATYARRAELPIDKAIAKGLIAAVKASKAGSITQAQSEAINGLLQSEDANPTIKTVVHWQLVRKNKLTVPRLLSSDLVYARADRPSTEDLALIKQGAVLSPEMPWKKSLTETADYTSAQKAMKAFQETDAWPKKNSGQVYWYSLDPRLNACTVDPSRYLYERDLKVDYFKKRDHWLTEDYWRRSQAESPLKRTSRMQLLFSGLASGQKRLNSKEQQKDTPAYISTVSFGRTKILSVLSDRLSKANRSGEADAIMTGYLFEDPIILPNMRVLSKRYRDMAKSQAKENMKAYARKKEMLSQEEYSLRAIASGMMSPSSIYYQSTLANLRNGQSKAAILASVSQAKAEAFKREQERLAKIERQRIQREQWLREEQLREEGRNRVSPMQQWEMACNAYIRNMNRQPTVIRNYLPNGCVEIIVKRYKY